MGRLSAGECAEVEQKLTAHPELHNFLMQIKSTPNGAIPTISTFPRRRLQPESLPRTPAVQSAVSKLDPERSIRFWRIATAAAVTLALIATYFAVTSQSSLKQSKAAFRDMFVRTLELTEEVRIADDKLNRFGGGGALAGSPAYTRIVLHGTGAAANANVSLFWNQRNGELFLKIQKPSGMATDKQYQLWAIRDDKPVSAGVFNIEPELIRMSAIDHATAFVISETGAADYVFDPGRIVLVGKTNE